MDAEQEKTWNIISGNRAWDVYLGHNYYNGREYDYSHRPFRVKAANEAEARQIVIENMDKIERFLRQKHLVNRWLIRRSEGYYMSERDIGFIGPTKLLAGGVMNRFGEIIQWSRREIV